jgi:hypothetical protein
MVNKSLRELLALVVVISVFASVASGFSPPQQGQPGDDEEQIKIYRNQIRVLIENAPSPGSAAEADYRSSLLSLRRKLRDLLGEKRGAWKAKIGNLQPMASTPEIARVVTALQDELRGVESEVADLEVALVQASPIASASPVAALPISRPVPKPPATRQTVTPSDVQNAFGAKVASLAIKDPEKSAAPEVTASALPQPACTDQGLPNIPAPSRMDTAFCGLAADIEERTTNKVILLSGDKGPLLTILIGKLLKTQGTESYVSFVTEAQEKRIDQQIGAGPSSQGTTSLVVKGGVPYLFGLAVENGAATQSQSDTTITYRVNPAGALKLFLKEGFIPAFRENEKDPFLKFLSKTSLGFTFDTSRGAQPGVFTGDKQQLAAFSARVEFFNDRDPRLKKYERAWEEFVATEQVKLGQEIYKTTLALNDFGSPTDPESFKDPALQAWLIQTNQALGTVSNSALPKLEKINQLARILREQADLLPVKNVSDETTTAITGFAERFISYTEAKDALLKRIAKGKIFTLEYTNTRGVNAPDLSNINFIAATGMGARIDLTANGSFTFFNKQLPPTTPAALRSGRIRDFQFAGQVAIPFKVGDGQFDFWFSGRYERLLENASTLNGLIVPGTRGDIAVGQVGLNIPINMLGIKFPVSITFANRTELIKEKEVRGNIGFTFNWDTVFSKIKPF